MAVVSCSSLSHYPAPLIMIFAMGTSPGRHNIIALDKVYHGLLALRWIPDWNDQNHKVLGCLPEDGEIFVQSQIIEPIETSLNFIFGDFVRFPCIKSAAILQNSPSPN